MLSAFAPCHSVRPGPTALNPNHEDSACVLAFDDPGGVPNTRVDSSSNDAVEPPDREVWICCADACNFRWRTLTFRDAEHEVTPCCICERGNIGQKLFLVGIRVAWEGLLAVDCLTLRNGIRDQQWDVNFGDVLKRSGNHSSLSKIGDRLRRPKRCLRVDAEACPRFSCRRVRPATGRSGDPDSATPDRHLTGEAAVLSSTGWWRDGGVGRFCGLRSDQVSL
jgi:hypothetical protein